MQVLVLPSYEPIRWRLLAQKMKRVRNNAYVRIYERIALTVTAILLGLFVATVVPLILSCLFPLVTWRHLMLTQVLLNSKHANVFSKMRTFPEVLSLRSILIPLCKRAVCEEPFLVVQ